MSQILTERDAPSTGTSSFLARLDRPTLSLVLLVLVFAGPIVHHWGEQQASRYALTAALWDQQTVAIDDFNFMLLRDRAVVDGITYSDKAPGQPFLAVPFYGLYRIVGGDSPLENYDPEFDVGQWWVTFWSAAVPGAVLAALMYRWAREIEPSTALAATVTMAFGTLIVVYSTILFGHVLAALFAFAMFLMVRKPDASWTRLLAAGALGGAAVLVEYPVALVVAVITVAAFIRHRHRAVALVAGGIPAAILLGLYHIRLFGDPFTFSYQWSAFSGPQQEANTVTGVFAGPTFERFVHVLISPRGLLIATPILLVAFVGFIPMWRKGWRFDVLTSLASVLAMIAIPMSWGNSYAGGAGPRYFVPALPFLVASLAVGWSRWRRFAVALAIISVVTMVAATLTEPQMGTQFEAGLRYWLTLAVQGNLEPTVYSVVAPGFAWVIYPASVLAAGYLLIRTGATWPVPDTDTSPTDESRVRS